MLQRIGLFSWPDPVVCSLEDRRRSLRPASAFLLAILQISCAHSYATNTQSKHQFTIRMSVSDMRRDGERMNAVVHVVIETEPLADHLASIGRGRVVISLFAESAGRRVEIANVDRLVAFDETVDRWTLDVPASWSIWTSRLALEVVERTSGASGEASTELAPLK